MVKVYGVPLSPFVRKVLITLEYKQVEYQLEPVLPFGVSDDYKKISPLGKIPALQDDNITIPDSTIICQYLDDLHPEPSILPKNPAQRAQALWIEEYMDTKGFEVLVRDIFFERLVKPKYLNEATDEALVAENIKVNVPVVLDYLTSLVPDNGFIFGNDLSVADITIGSTFVNARYGEFTVDKTAWPKLAAYIDRVFATKAFGHRLEQEQALLS